MSAPGQRAEAVKPLARALVRLVNRLEALELRLDAEEHLWTDYRDTAVALAAVLAQASPGAQAGLLTTAEMAGMVGITPKSLLRAKAKGRAKPALQLGRLIRWKGSEVVR